MNIILSSFFKNEKIVYLELHIDSTKTLYLILIDVEFQITKGTVTFLGHTMSKLQNCKL